MRDYLTDHDDLYRAMEQEARAAAAAEAEAASREAIAEMDRDELADALDAARVEKHEAKREFVEAKERFKRASSRLAWLESEASERTRSDDA